MVRTCVSARSAENSVCGAVAGIASGAFSSAMASTASKTMKHQTRKDENNEEVDEIGDCASAIRNGPAFRKKKKLDCTACYGPKRISARDVILAITNYGNSGLRSHLL